MPTSCYTTTICLLNSVTTGFRKRRGGGIWRRASASGIGQRLGKAAGGRGSLLHYGPVCYAQIKKTINHNSKNINKNMNNKFSLKSVATIVTCFAMCVAINGCDSSKIGDDITGGSNKLSPPSWIQGTWVDEYGAMTVTCTSDDVLMNNVSFRVLYANVPGVGKASLKESKKTDSHYEISVSVTESGKETVTDRIGFQKGSNYIIIGEADGNDPMRYDDEYRLYKK